MSKPDWGALQQQYIAAHSRTGISPSDWCEELGLNYATARRYIKKPPKAAQSTNGKTAQTAQKKMRKSAQKDSAQTAQKQPKKTQKRIPEKIIPATPAGGDDSIFNPDDFGISSLQGEFARFVAEGKNPSDSYRLAGYKSEGESVHSAASRLLRNVKVARAIRWLRDKRQKRLALTEAEIIHQLSSIASADPSLISHVRRVNCRYCWGDDHLYQYRDDDEYEKALKKANDDGKPVPEYGGVGFVDSAIPNEDCPRCFGEGAMQTFFADTSALDGPERWLVTGVEETMNGLKVKMASPEAARRELLAYIKATRGSVPATGDNPATGKEALELQGMQLRNEKLQAEIENIRNGKNESNLVVVHNALQIPGAVQPTQSDVEGE